MERMRDVLIEVIRLHTTGDRWTPEGLADTVLDALMEPSDGMNFAGEQVGDFPWDGKKPSRVFVAMIKAAKDGK